MIGSILWTFHCCLQALLAMNPTEKIENRGWIPRTRNLVWPAEALQCFISVQGSSDGCLSILLKKTGLLHDPKAMDQKFMDCVRKFGIQGVLVFSCSIRKLLTFPPCLALASLGRVTPVEVFCQVPFSGTPSIGHCPSDNTNPQSLVSVEMPILCFYNGMPWRGT